MEALLEALITSMVTSTPVTPFLVILETSFPATPVEASVPVASVPVAPVEDLFPVAPPVPAEVEIPVSVPSLWTLIAPTVKSKTTTDNV